MGEIRSTLDIIMEKTKGLTLTDSEKQELQREEVEGRVRGLFQKYADGAINLERLKREVDAFGEKRHEMAGRALLEECLTSLDLEGDEDPVLEVLKHLVNVDPNPLRVILAEFREDLKQKKDATEEMLRGRLEKLGVSGSAVMPNIKADQGMAQYLSEKREMFHDRLDSFRSSLSEP